MVKAPEIRKKVVIIATTKYKHIYTHKFVVVLKKEKTCYYWPTEIEIDNPKTWARTHTDTHIYIIGNRPNFEALLQKQRVLIHSLKIALYEKTLFM